MARQQKVKTPRLKFNVKDAAGFAIGDVVAKNAGDAKLRAEATYPDAVKPLTVEQTKYESNYTEPEG